MAQEDKAVDLKYDEQSAKQWTKLAAMHDSNVHRYEELHAATDAAYQKLRNEAYINKALSDLAGGPAVPSMTHRQRGMSALLKEVGAVKRQRQDYSREIDLALRNLAVQHAANLAYTEGMNEARREAERLQRSQFDAEMGIRRDYFELDKKNTAFDRMYKLYTSRRIDKNAFRDATGYAVKAMPAPRKKKAPKPMVKFVGSKMPDKAAPGYMIMEGYNKTSRRKVYYEVEENAARVMKEKGISLQDNSGNVRSDAELYAIGHYGGFAGADAKKQLSILETNKKDFTKRFGEWCYELFYDYYQGMAEGGRFFSEDDQSKVTKAFNDILDAAATGGDVGDAIEAYQKAFNNGLENLFKSIDGSGLWSIAVKMGPQAFEQFRYAAGADDKNKFLDAPPASATSKAIVGLLKKKFGDLSGSLFKDVFEEPELAHLNPQWSRLSVSQLLAVYAYMVAKHNPRMAEQGALDEKAMALVQSGKAIYEEIEAAYMDEIIKIGDSLYEENRQSSEPPEGGGEPTRRDKFKRAVEAIRQYPKSQEEMQFYVNYDVDAGQKELDEKKAKRDITWKGIVQLLKDKGYFVDFLYTGIFTDKFDKLGNIQNDLKERGELGSADELASLTKQLKHLDDEIPRLDETIRTAKQVQEQAEKKRFEQGILSKPDFAQVSGIGAAAENPLVMDVMFGGDVKNVVTYAEYLLGDAVMNELDHPQLKERDITSGALSQWIEAERSIYEKYTRMTDEEKGVYNYLIGKGDKNGADDYLKRLEEDLNRRKGLAEAEKLKGEPVAQYFHGFLAGFERFASGIGQRLPTTATQFASSAIYEDLAERGPKLPDWLGGKSVGQMVHDVAGGVGYMSPAFALATMSAGLGAPAAVTKGISALMVGSSAKGNAYNYALQQGYTKEQAETYSTLTGVSEAALQYALSGIRKLGGGLTGNIAEKAIRNINSAVLRVAAEMPILMGGEFSEELLQAALEPVIRNIAFDENNKFRLFTPENLYQGLIGALTVLPFELGPTIARNVKYEQLGHGVNEARKADDLIARALEMAPKTEAHKLARKLADGIIHKNEYNIGELLMAYAQAGGDMAFMKAPRAEMQGTETAVSEQPEPGSYGVRAMSPEQIGQRVQERIQKNVQAQPDVVQKALVAGMSTLIGIETRLRTESRNINYNGFNVESSQTAYIAYQTAKRTTKAVHLGVAAETMAADIRAAFATGQLTKAEAGRLQEVLSEIVGDASLAQAYMD